MKRLLIIFTITVTAFIGFVFYTTPAKKKSVKAVPSVSNSPTLPSPYDDLLTAYEEYINESLKLTGTPGAAIAIIQDSSIIYLKGFGVRNTETNEPVDTHTVFRLASVSKCLTAVLTGVMVNDGVFNWDDPVVKYVPDLELKSPEYTQQLTIRNVLSHTTGLPYHTYTNLIEEGKEFSVLREELKNVDMISAPGKVYSYQNVAYSLISDVINNATGNSFAEEMKSRIFGPLHMANASVSYEEMIENKNIAQPHLHRGRKWKTIPISPTYYNTAPAGGINASITDMAKLMIALLGNKEQALPKSAIAEIFEPEVRATAKNRNFNRWSRVKKSYYGLGWRILQFKNDTIAYHGGYVNGYRSEIAINPEKRVAICVLANGPGGFSDHAIPAFFNTYDKFMRKPVKEEALIATP